MIKSVGAVCAAIALSSVTPAAAAELVTNGGFETGTLSPWTATGNVGVFPTPYFGLSDARYGRFIAAFNGGDTTPNGVLSQTLATAAGTGYNFSFNYGVTSGGNQSIIASILDGTTLAVLGTQTVSSTSSTPGQFGFNFTAASASTIVRFRDVSTNSTTSQDGAIDNVSVNAVPEPATWAMLMLGFGCMGYAMRRRSKTSTRIRFA